MNFFKKIGIKILLPFDIPKAAHEYGFSCLAMADMMMPVLG
jgi:hypothetical protein